MFTASEAAWTPPVTDAQATPFDTDEARWQAVQARDKAADGAFLFAVRTTGIYCKPSCPSRTPNRANVSFHATAEAARRHGFRACKRCRPDASGGEALDVQVATSAARMIDAAIAADAPLPRLEQLADKAGYSPFHFHRMFRKVLGLTPKGYAAAVRARRMADALQAGPSVTEAIYDAGYSSSSRFYETATARLGMAPRTRRDGGQGETIRHAVARCSLGLVLVAETARGVCAITFGDDAAALENDLRRRFPNAELVGDDPAFAGRVDAVVALIERPGIGHDLPLDLRGTAFQERVWQALRAIPVGQTASYAAIAAAIGQPRAVRGVASACAANPTAVAVPCHRVVRSDGALAGYRWGVARKAALLAREGAR